MDFSNYKFRCHALGNLLVNSRSKDELLSETTKTYLKEAWIKEVFDREKIITTKYMDKGIACETDSLELVEKVLGKKYFKNQKEFSNEYIAGIPDVVDAELVVDVKTSWDIWTFASVDEAKARSTYYAQLLGYMWLTGKTKAKLAYCLVNTPEEQIEYEMYKLKVSGAIKDTEEEIAQARMNFIFDDIPEEKRLKTYDFEIDPETQTKLIERIKLAREYMSTLSL